MAIIASKKGCKCESGLLNTGAGCSPLMDVTDKIIVVPIYDSTGAKNRIQLSSFAFDSTSFKALINQSDASKRWYPVPRLKNVTDERAEPELETFDDNTKIPIRQGLREFTGLAVEKDAPVKLIGKLNAITCKEVGIYIIDLSG